MVRFIAVDARDDLDHTQPATHTRRVGIDGVWYELDLGDKNNAALDEFLKPFVASARRVTGKTITTAIRNTQLDVSRLPLLTPLGDPAPPTPESPTPVRYQHGRKPETSGMKEWKARVRAWAREHENPVINEPGFVAGHVRVTLQAEYVAANPSDPRPEATEPAAVLWPAAPTVNFSKA